MRAFTPAVAEIDAAPRELEAAAYEPPEWQPARIAPVARIKQFHPRCTVKLWTQHQGKTVRIAR